MSFTPKKQMPRPSKSWVKNYKLEKQQQQQQQQQQKTGQPVFANQVV